MTQPARTHAQAAFSIGVDVGGTNTDAVLMQGRSIVAQVKTPTTADVTTGIVTAISAILAQAATEAACIGAVMIGTTHFTNALVERRRLSRIGVMRLGYPATTAIPPLYGWPSDLAAVVRGDTRILPGGFEFNGQPITALDEPAIAAAARDFRAAGLQAVAISCVFAPMNASQEIRAAELVRDVWPDVPVTLSSAFGGLGLLERENAAAMNAALLALADHVVSAFAASLRTLFITAPLFISQNDGTLMQAAYAAAHPVMTFASGPTNSMRGAALLSGVENALVIDIGGTTADIGCLVNGFPRESALAVDIGGVRTNLRMPDLVSIGLGGGSLVRDLSGLPRIGPESVGHLLRNRALVFGGDTLTATDIAVANGRTGIGNPEKVAHIPRAQIEAARDRMRTMLEDGVERMKMNATDIPIVLVGGGSILVDFKLGGVSNIIVPPGHGVANAAGAAIAQAGGEVDRCYSYAEWGRDAALDDARRLATQRAIDAGADAATVAIVEQEELPIAYLAGGSTRIRIRAVGDMQI
jgi:N-methylhydantoinase A/oxoprolinase/acetone carboxylase beta subunit